MYDLTDGGKRARERIVVSLGFWHSYKHVNLALYKKFAPTFLAGCFHCLYPHQPFYPKPSYLSIVIVMLTMVRLAYPSFKDDLVHALTLDLGRGSRAHLLNLQTLCEFFIPVVCLYISSTAVLCWLSFEHECSHTFI